MPEPVVAYPVAGGPARRGPSRLDRRGRPGRLNELGPQSRSPEASLADLWHNVGLLREHRLAHRRLRCENVLLDDNDQVWLTGLVLAELRATDRQLATDVAELLASLAVLLGVNRTVTSGWAGWAPRPLRRGRLSAAASAIRRDPSAQVRGYDRARSERLSGGRAGADCDPEAVLTCWPRSEAKWGKVTGEPPAHLEPLGRFTWKRTLALLGAFAVIYLVLPQLANAGSAVHAFRNVRIGGGC